MHDIDDLMSGLDGPVALPPDLRARLTRVLTGDDEPLLAGVDAPHDLSSAQRDRLTELLLAPPLPTPMRLRVQTRWLAVAAAILLIIGGVTATTIRRTGSSHRSSGLAATGPGTTVVPRLLPNSAPTAVQDTAGSSSNAAAGEGGSAGVPGPPTAAASGSASAGTAFASGTPAPPFAFGSPAAASMPAPEPGATTTAPPPAAPPAPIAVVGGDRAERDGFNAYLSELNQSGSRQIQVVAPGTRGALATVNLSDTALAGGSTIPVLETMAVPERVLHAPVYDTASAPAHQAEVAVSAVFPKATTGKVAAVYRGAQGVWTADVANAMVAALRAANVTPVVMSYVPGSAFRAVPADVAFLSLDTGDAKAWFADAARAQYRPAMGVAGISSLVDPTLVGSLPDGTVAVGAYDLTGKPEQGVLANLIQRTPGMAEVHGWVTAKVLAVTLWKSGAATAAQLAAALGQLPGYDDGWSPPLAFRPDTTSRTPDGVVFTVRRGAYVTNHAFATDKS